MKNHPYAPLAPRLPEGDLVDPRALVRSEGQPIELEIGPGRGGFLFERLAAEPSVCVIGLEIRLKWATIVDRRLHDLGLSGRGRVFAEDARHAVRRFPAGSLRRIFVHFPDPWWKKRHQKRLVLGRDLLEELARALTPQGEVFVQTDVAERAELYQSLFLDSAFFEPFGPSVRVEENPFAARSPRERRALADGLPIYRLHFRRREPGRA
jgi:tRNA (guanine-N7-)-methyltransferase